MRRIVQTAFPRKLRGRRGRARAGQVSAVATIFGLLLVVAFIAQFEIAPLPGQLALAELGHVSEVENQMGRLQVDVLALAGHSNMPLSIVTPITLGSTAVPPFGLASPGMLGPDTHEYANLTYTTSRIFPFLPLWNATPGCSDTGSPCNKGVEWDNITGTPNSTYSFKLNGGSPSFLLNFTGSYDSITVNWLGKSIGITYLEFNGSYLHITMDKGSNGGGGNPRIVVLVYGQHDVVETALNGQGIDMRTSFVGTDGSQICPATNLSSTDSFYWNGTGNSNTAVNVTWFNNVGYDTGPTVFTFGTTSTESFQNVSLGNSGCAWTRAYASSYPVELGPGIAVNLQNRYVSDTVVAFDHGAVVASTAGAGSTMISPPPFEFTESTAGWDATIHVVNVIANRTAASGTGLVGVVTQLVSVDTATLTQQLGNGEYFTGAFFNLTTAYPEAWTQFFQQLPSTAIVSGPTCIEIGAAFTSGSCLAPPPGHYSQIRGQIALAELTLIEATVTESVT